jgi:16S rRNA (cytosine1402-N4)-methyltransferase
MATTSGAPHLPVLLQPTLQLLALRPGDHVIDGTVGAGGHAEAMLSASTPDGRLLGLDLDDTAISLAAARLARFGSRAMLVRANYADAIDVVRAQAFGPVAAALVDFGTSSMDLDDPTRGFSFRQDGPLDMRFDQGQEFTAAAVVNTYSEDELARVIAEFGEERFARRIAQALVRARRDHRVVGTLQLVDVIASAVPSSYRRGQLHFATRTFQALRIEVNGELANVRRGLESLYQALMPGGRLAAISFHSLEDRIVKRFFQERALTDGAEILTKKPIVADDAEKKTNPRSRSAKLRALRKP